MYHKDLEAWKKSIELVTKIYFETKDFPQEEKYGLTEKQMAEKIQKEMFQKGKELVPIKQKKAKKNKKKRR